MVEVLLAKFTENAISNLKLGIIELLSLVSYRFVSLSVVTIVLVVLNLGLSPLRYLGVLYVLAVDTYFCVRDVGCRNWSWRISAKICSRRKEHWVIRWPWGCIYSPRWLLCGTAACCDLLGIIFCIDFVAILRYGIKMFGNVRSALWLENREHFAYLLSFVGNQPYLYLLSLF